MRRPMIALLLAVALLMPSLTSAAEFQAFFPAGANFAIDILTSSSLDGVHHQHLGLNLENLDLYAVSMLGSGTPNSPSGRPWLYGKIAKVEQLSVNTFRVTWNVSSSANGLNFLPIGTIVITFLV